VQAEILAKTITTESSSPETKERSIRAASRADLKERALRLSQSPTPRNSEGNLSAQSSRPEVEMPQSIAVAINNVAEDSTQNEAEIACSKLETQNEAEIA